MTTSNDIDATDGGEASEAGEESARRQQGPMQPERDRRGALDTVIISGLSGAGRSTAAKVLEDAKSDVSWGNQIRSYVLDQSRIKDLRTNYEVGNTQAVLDGDLDDFIGASLKQGV